ncbi:MAG TPA: integrin alpha [Actinomycetota bacterium]|nr:integrin alpha [Actinomycetota bacterium]
MIGVAPYDRSRGAAYVVFGKSDGEGVDAQSLGDAGLLLRGATKGSATGWAVDAAGDVNRDGFGDVLVGAPHYPDGDHPFAYVVYGRAEPGRIVLQRRTLPGFSIKAERRTTRFGDAVAAAGDVDGDGTGDFLVGAPRSNFGNGTYSGAAYVISGKGIAGGTVMGGLVDLTTRSPRAFRVDGMIGARSSCSPVDPRPCHGDAVGDTLAPLGDMNGDGLADFALAAQAAGPRREGAVFVVWGARGLLR